MLFDAVLDDRTTNALKDHATLGKTAIPRTKPIVLLLVSKQAWDSFEAHFRGPFSSGAAQPWLTTETSKNGWVVFGIFMVCCLPLFWIGLLVKENYRLCSTCE